MNISIDLLTQIFVFIFGVCFGSFANVLTVRIPEGKSILRPPSSCDFCGARIKPSNLIPILSYLFLKGKSKCCQNRLSWEYLFIELATGLLFLLSYSISGFSLKFIALCILSILSLPLTIIDFKIKRLPNNLTYSGFFGGLTVLILTSINNQDLRILIDGLIVILLSTLVFFVIYIVSKGGMGLGDVKLAAMLASITSLVNWQVMFVGIIIAFLTGAISGIILLMFTKATRKSAIPFGPFMILGIWIALLLSPQTLSNITKLWALQ